MNNEELENKIKTLNKEIFMLKRKLEMADERHSLSLFNNYVCKIYSSLPLTEIFKTICNEYCGGNNNLPQLKKIQGGESLKKFYKLTIDNTNYLFSDFSLADEEATHFVKLTQFYSDEIFCFPKIYYFNDNIVITDFVNGSTIEEINNGTVRHKLMNDVNLKCVDWIINFKKTECPLVDKNESVKFWKNLSEEKLISLINISGETSYINKAQNLVNELYTKSKICMCHNDFMFGNIMWDDVEKSIKIIDYHDCSYNIDHYDIVSYLYTPKKYFSDKERHEILSHYYDNLTMKPNYITFLSNIIKIAYVRIVRSMDLRFKKFFSGNKSLLLLIELRRGLNYMKSLESFIDIRISDNLEKLLPINNVCSISLCAGFGKRMGGDQPKCASQILGKSMIEYITNSLNSFVCNKNIYVVGYKKNIMIDIVKECSDNYLFVSQDEQLGTGHAVIQTIPYLEDGQTCFIIMGDMPVITNNLLMDAYLEHKKSNAVTTVISAKLKEINSNGKIIKDENGEFIQILEYKDIDMLYSSDEAELMKEIKEVNTGLYVFETTELKKYLLKLDNKNSQNEYYLTDIIKLQKNDKLKVHCALIENICEPTGANTQEELKKIEDVFSL